MSEVAFACDENCENQLPLAEFNDCAPEFLEGGVNVIYFANIGYPILADPTDPVALLAELTARISNTSLVANAIRYLNVLGGKPAPTENEITRSKNRKYVLNKDHVIDIIVDELNDTNYGLLKALECAGDFLVWPDSGGYLYGGDVTFGTGIDANIKLNHIIPQSNKEVQTLTGVVTWTAKYHSVRVTNPLS